MAGRETIFDKGAGVLQNARHGAGSVAGNRTRGSQWPQLLTTGQGLVFDVIPSAGSSRVIDLDTTTLAASAVSIVVGYPLSAPDENIPPAAGPVTRDFAARIEFGTGNACFVVEVDILNGARVSVAGDSVEISILDYTVQDNDPSAPYWRLENMAAASYLPGLNGYRTQKALLPCTYTPGATLEITTENLQQCLVDLQS